MGSLVGHAGPGLVFFIAGLWHLFNHIKLYILNQDSYISLPWFPIPKCRHLELLYILFSGIAYIALEFVIGLGQRPLDPNGSIPAIHLHNFEHSLIIGSFLAYSSLAIALDRFHGPRVRDRAKHSMTYLLFAMALAQQLNLFYHHSTGAHAGPEGQYHSILVLLTFVTLLSTLTAIILPKSFIVSFVKSLGLLFIGIWFFMIGVMLWTPGLVPKGCFMELDGDGNTIVTCSGQEALHRANSLVNLQFGVLLILVVSFGVSMYLVMVNVYGEKVEYVSLKMDLDDEDNYDGQLQRDVESQDGPTLQMVNNI